MHHSFQKTSPFYKCFHISWHVFILLFDISVHSNKEEIWPCFLWLSDKYILEILAPEIAKYFKVRFIWQSVIGPLSSMGCFAIFQHYNLFLSLHFSMCLSMFGSGASKLYFIIIYYYSQNWSKLFFNLILNGTLSALDLKALAPLAFQRVDANTFIGCNTVTLALAKLTHTNFKSNFSSD
jgi:hypothetical protein